MLRVTSSFILLFARIRGKSENTTQQNKQMENERNVERTRGCQSYENDSSERSNCTVNICAIISRKRTRRRRQRRRKRGGGSFHPPPHDGAHVGIVSFYKPYQELLPELQQAFPDLALQLHRFSLYLTLLHGRDSQLVVVLTGLFRYVPMHKEEGRGRGGDGPVK